MPKSRDSVLAALLFVAVGGTASLHAGLDLFLKLDTVNGESLDYAHRDEIEVLEWSWGMSKPAPIPGAASQRVSVGNLSLGKYVDAASPHLMNACASGATFKSALLTLRTAGNHPLVICTISLSTVMVVSVSNSGSGGEDRLTENISLDFAQMSLTYTPSKSAIPQTGLSFAWNIPENTGANESVMFPPLQPVGGLASTLTYSNGAPIGSLSWVSTPGANYQVWVANDVNAPFQRYGRPTPSSGGGPTSLPVPADAVRKFFRVETLSPQ